MTPPSATAASPTGWDDGLASRLRGFGPLGLVAILVILLGNLVVVPLSAILVLLWARWSRTPLPEIGYVRPRSWPVTVAVGIGFGIALKLAMKAIVMPLLGADPINHNYHHLVGNTAALPGMLFLVIVGAGWGEETLFRGYLFERLGKLLGTSAWAKIGIVVLASALFGLAHEGWPSVQQAALVGLILGTVYATVGQLPMLMIAHAAFDVTALAIIYWNLETAVATAIFR